MTFQPALRNMYIDALRQDMLVKSEADPAVPERVFLEVALDYLGYDDNPESRAENISDGPGDFGLDAWFVSDDAATLFQFKSTDYSDDIDPECKVSPAGLADLPRIFSLIKSPDAPPKEANAKVKDFLKRFRSTIHRRAQDTSKADIPYHVQIQFVALARDFTPQAAEEFKKITSDHAFTLGGVPIDVRYRAIFLDDLVADRWREKNSDWRDRNGMKRDEIEFHVVGSVIEEPKSLVFFTRAFDLVTMFEDFGYQVFEPNVRCEIKKSKVNEAIRGSVSSHRGRKEFRHLNNGITIIAAGFQKIGKPAIKRIKVRQPGVINGLQTIKSIYDAFQELSTEHQKDFIDNCAVLMRLHTRDAVAEYRSLVKSTNNQNPMQQRNLRANDPEQIAFERLFAEFNWFYERKEGAWSAFKGDAKLWGTLRGRKPTDFMYGKTVRSVDNEELGQTWLAFLGFANEAVHERSQIFGEPKIYDLVFLRRTKQHGSAYGFKLDLDRILPDTVELAPDPKLMLVSYLCREFARQVVPSFKSLRDDSIKRMGIQNMQRDKQNNKLQEDTRYVEGLIMRALSYVFPEFVGYCLFKAFGVEAHSKGAKLIENGTLNRLSKKADFKTIRDEIAASTWTLNKDDLLQVMWYLFSECVGKLVASNWRQQWAIAPNRTRFNYRPSTRELLFKELDQLDDYISEVELTRKWAVSVNKSKGIYKFVGAILK